MKLSRTERGPVLWAVYRVDYDLMAALIAKKAKVDVSNEFGYTPLAEATKQGDARMVKMLMDAGSGTEGANADGQTALMLAIKNGDLPIFQMLIDAGAKVNVVEKVQDQTPLMWAAAATRNGAEMVKVLIAKGAYRKRSRQVQRLAKPDYVGTSRAISRVWWAYTAVVRSPWGLPGVRRSASQCRRRYQFAYARRRDAHDDRARQQQ
jgi:ankyrin repeat protein